MTVEIYIPSKIVSTWVLGISLQLRQKLRLKRFFFWICNVNIYVASVSRWGTQFDKTQQNIECCCFIFLCVVYLETPYISIGTLFPDFFMSSLATEPKQPKHESAQKVEFPPIPERAPNNAQQRSAPVQGQRPQLKQTSDATSLLRLCGPASVSHCGKGTSDVASRAPRDEGRSCRCRPFDFS